MDNEKRLVATKRDFCFVITLRNCIFAPLFSLELQFAFNVQSRSLLRLYVVMWSLPLTCANVNSVDVVVCSRRFALSVDSAVKSCHDLQLQSVETFITRNDLICSIAQLLLLRLEISAEFTWITCFNK